tara:strand:- start:427 stop:705 length:279 start_codon:yes stop_codon:yes gene_type:complete
MYKNILKSVFLISIIFFGIFSIFFYLWIKRYFGDIEFDLILININFGLQGLVDADDYVINKFFEYCIYAPIIISLLIFVVQYRLFKKKFIKY